MTNETRRIDLSVKLMQMGEALTAEGVELKDYSISQSGNALIALSSIILSDEDMFLFSQFCLMFTAKKVLDSTKGFDDSAAVRQVMNQKNVMNEIPKKKTRKPRGPKPPEE